MALYDENTLQLAMQIGGFIDYSVVVFWLLFFKSISSSIKEYRFYQYLKEKKLLNDHAKWKDEKLTFLEIVERRKIR